MITIKEIARLSGCSVATVNRALHDRPDISPKTKERIKAIAKENGYRPHIMARSLVKGRTNIIGLIVLDIQNPFFSQLIALLNRDLLQKGYSLHLGIMDGSPGSEYQMLEQLACMKVDGIIHFPLNTGDQYKTYLKQLHIPLVHLCNWLDDDFPFVGVNEEQAMIDAVECIRDKGYEEIIYISPPLRYRGDRNLYTLEERLKGVEKAAGDMNLHVIMEKDFSDKTISLIRKSKKRPCILCSSDIFALDVIPVLREEDLLAPRDYGIMGFDNISTLRYITPRLSTMAYPMEELARQTLAMLLDQIEGAAQKRITLDACIVKGETL